MLEALQPLLIAIKKRTILVFLLIHLGLALGIYALARTTVPDGWHQTTIVFLAAIVCLYGGVLLGVFFVAWPLLPLIRKIQKAENWYDRVMRDLPFFLEQLPKIIAAIQSLIATVNTPKTKTTTKKDS